MSTVVVTLVLLCIAIIATASYFWLVLRRRQRDESVVRFSTPSQRKLSQKERDAVERYLRQNEGLGQTPITHRNNLIILRDKLTLTTKSENVYSLKRAITRYGVASEDPNKWRYFLDATEIHLPPFWEQYIAQENQVELIKTQSLPLVISLNGHTLADHVYEGPAPVSAVMPPQPQNASIRHEESEHIELVKVRRETREEHALTRSNGVKEALAVSAILLMFFVTLQSPVMFLPWLLAISAGLAVWVIWRLVCERLGKNRKEIHCLRGLPKRWGLFGESKQGDISNISLGAVDLIYPPHWQPYIGRDLGQPTDVEVYMNSHVVRQGSVLSLHEEVKKFPLQQWGRNLVLATSAFLLLLALLVYVPLGLPLKLSVAWLQGAQSSQVNSVQELEKAALRVGDTLKVQGTGMCYVPPSASRSASGFMPFDCSAIYWNTATPLPVPQSEIIDAATALQTTVNNQLHPGQNQAPEQNINPQLATAIEKSGMILLDDFADIVLKTEALCGNSNDCVRLKNALVNLGNSSNWNSLLKRAKAGTLQGINVLLRPVSAQSLSELVNNATSSFFIQETRRAADSLNSPPPGGFLISNDEGRQLIELPVPPVGVFANPPQEQWKQLQHLSTQLLHTPFSAQGVITSISVDANGTRHISLHSEPDISTLWRYLGTSLLLFLLVGVLLVNTVLFIRRFLQDKRRIDDIQQYYNSCFHPTLVTMPAHQLG
ncbi:MULTISPECIES: intracellular growth attenuator family protein [Rahnella]|uniref:intracellular growth attenuator family protein n=1 Tax=Rahnella TaxID=34037 RepID=UPI0010ECC7C1|nr:MULTISPECIES: intracellular growth attenuator family protein [Rahnella]TDS93242.1 intracellular growth attenuator protein IgaA [Rahnella sp. BIGb0236]